ncbi:MAG: dipicolinate synthase subunit DpsA [Clostridia bacterium]|nr:dipicolinate synthase subunit DpsA [Clostridia bacterium]
MKTVGILSILGGDKRQIYLAELLENKGYRVRKFGISPKEDNCGSISEALDDAALLLLPTPVTRDGYRINAFCDILVSELTQFIPDTCKVIGGGIPPRIKDYFKSERIEFSDLFDDSEYLCHNADITAEGAVSLLMKELDMTIDGANILVCGYGRIGKSLSAKLTALGANVTVAARRSADRLLALERGIRHIDHINYSRKGIFDITKSYDAILNTVPSWVFEDSNSSLLKDSVYIELASPPYGGEAEFMKKNCGKYILAPGIPGKYAPMSAAKAMYMSLPLLYRKGE